MAKKKSERKEIFFRIIVSIISGIVLNVWSGLVGILALLNWLIVIFSGKKNKELANFCEYWNTETYKFIRYMTLVSNKRPFPFSKLERISRVE